MIIFVCGVIVGIPLGFFVAIYFLACAQKKGKINFKFND